jgi:hypothetical protein
VTGAARRSILPRAEPAMRTQTADDYASRLNDGAEAWRPEAVMILQPLT